MHHIREKLRELGVRVDGPTLVLRVRMRVRMKAWIQSALLQLGESINNEIYA